MLEQRDGVSGADAEAKKDGLGPPFFISICLVIANKRFHSIFYFAHGIPSSFKNRTKYYAFNRIKAPSFKFL